LGLAPPSPLRPRHSHLQAEPTESTALSGKEFAGAIALFMGIPDPNIVEAKEMMGNPSFFQDCGSRRREFDTLGHSLSNYMGRDHLRTKYHNDIEREIHFLATTVGMSMRMTPTDLFLRDILPQNRQRYVMATRGGRRPDHGRFNGALVPDLYHAESRTMYDL
jgi:hypothetical protein